jgi:hypothetical protein
VVEVIAADSVVEVKVACAQEVETAKSSKATETKSCFNLFMVNSPSV